MKRFIVTERIKGRFGYHYAKLRLQTLALISSVILVELHSYIPAHEKPEVYEWKLYSSP